MMEDVSGGEGDDPESDDNAADGDDPVTGGAVVGSELGGLADAEHLSAETDGHEERAESEGEPCHGLPMYRIGCAVVKRKIRVNLVGYPYFVRKTLKRRAERAPQQEGRPRFRHEAKG